MTYEEIIARVAEEIGLPTKLVQKTYTSYWRAVREYIASLPLKDGLSDEEFDNLRVNINIPSLGKFYLTKERYKAMMEKHKRFVELKNKKNHVKDYKDHSKIHTGSNNRQ